MTDLINNRIQQAILNSGKSKAQIAREIGVSAQAVSNWTTDGSIDKTNLLKLCEATGSSEKWIISGKTDNNHNSINEEPSQYAATPMIIPELSEVVEYAITHQLSEYYAKLPPAGQVKFILELYNSVYQDRALLDIAKDMQPATLLKIIGN